MKLIIGLGNPGQAYEKTRHNVGFMAVDAYAKSIGVDFKLDSKLKGMIANVNILGNKAILLKPQTFMNLSGESVSLVMKYYKIDVEDMLVISDDLDSPTGRVRLRAEGSAGGHNGHKDIIKYVGTTKYKRLKIGIDRSNVIPVADWVLQKFTNDEVVNINNAVNIAGKAIDDFIRNVDFVKIASKYSTNTLTLIN